jgi:Asp-tRNA(Asn)/Glu-tRNA(Gln) amidotransferase A subunit family amidase
MSRAVEDAAARLGADPLEPPARWDNLVAAARLINDYEGARTHEARYREFGARLGARLAQLIERGLATPTSQYDEALATVRAMRDMVAEYFARYTAILSPAATGPAPAGLESTGDPANNAAWTALGVPAIAVPLPVDGPPLGLQIVAAWDGDDELTALAAAVEQRLSLQ